MSSTRQVRKVKKKLEFIERKPKIVLITGWWRKKNRSIFGTSLKLVRVLESLSEEMTWIVTNCSNMDLLNESKNKINIINIETIDLETSFWKKLLCYFPYQVKILINMIKLIINSKADIVIFAFNADFFILPIIVASLSGKKVVLRTDGRGSIMLKKHHEKTNRDKIVFFNIKIILFDLAEKITYIFANRIVPESEYMIVEYNLQKYLEKIDIGSLYADFSFRKIKDLTDRKYIEGYVGHLFQEKGVLNFVKSLPLILKNGESKAIIIGSGDLEGEIKEILADDNIKDKVKLIGWVENKEVPTYLNDIQIVVVPSYQEGLPNIVLESMACGCIVLATSVGGIPDVIKDGKTGFIMENNSPECIAKNVVRALKHPDLEMIVGNARALVEQEFTYEAAVERYRKILGNL